MDETTLISRQEKLEREKAKDTEIIVSALKELTSILTRLSHILALTGVAIIQAGDAHPSKFTGKKENLPLKQESEVVLNELEILADISESESEEE